MTTYKVGYFVGSLSSTSINRILSKALIRVAPDDLEFSEIPIGNLPLYSPDFDDDYPPEAERLKASIAAVDAILFVTPEYNRSIPGGAEERDRLGVPTVGPELLRPHPGRRDRRLDRPDRHRRGSAEPARGAQLLQRPADDLPEAYIQRPSDNPGLNATLPRLCCASPEVAAAWSSVFRRWLPRIAGVHCCFQAFSCRIRAFHARPTQAAMKDQELAPKSRGSCARSASRSRARCVAAGFTFTRGAGHQHRRGRRG